MTTSERFKQELQAGNLDKAFELALEQAIELEIVTWVSGNTAESTLNGLNSPNPTQRIRTRLNLLDGRIENEVGSQLLRNGISADLREFHSNQIKEGQALIQNNLKTLQVLLQTWTLAKSVTRSQGGAIPIQPLPFDEVAEPDASNPQLHSSSTLPRSLFSGDLETTTTSAMTSSVIVVEPATAPVPPDPWESESGPHPPSLARPIPTPTPAEMAAHYLDQSSSSSADLITEIEELFSSKRDEVPTWTANNGGANASPTIPLSEQGTGKPPSIGDILSNLFRSVHSSSVQPPSTLADPEDVFLSQSFFDAASPAAPNWKLKELVDSDSNQNLEQLLTDLFPDGDSDRQSSQ
jgi:hypothetical protein